MQRVRLIKSCKYGRKDEVVVMDNNEAFGLIDSGIAILTKDMAPDDYKQAGDKNGKFTKLRSNHSK